MQKKLVGVDIGGTTVKFALINVDGSVEKKWHIKTDTSQHGERMPYQIVKSMTENTDMYGDEVIGIGVGVPGQISADGKSVVRAVNLGWHNVPLKVVIESEFNKPVVLVNDANAAALGEMWQGAAKGKSNLIFVILGTGVGGGIIVDGKVLNGVHSSGGEIGHIPVNTTEQRVCGCGNVNCLETFSSATGVIKTAKKLLDEAGVDRGSFDTKDVFSWLDQGDPIAEQVVSLTVKYLGQAIAGIMNTVDAEGVVVGGGLSEAGDPLLEPLRKSIDKYIFPQIKNRYFVRKAALGNDAGILGDVYPLLKVIGAKSADSLSVSY
ncbi:ROK family protein [Lactiplantibacillus pentosus]|uniref:ROK family protein n=1 Tax=Lactiplantibacillus pentosus TaxID=1589 RepID=UPI00132F788D|nr:ROK family protein [Lactiplantibacillus pentosus]MBQ0837344.1 ROK family protein [Lactiplantibacillus pentosus]MBU7465029.1 ROK family protein [Lactiplantibacillus pentosus]MBU7490996.1 ROK family protein [Lactiplantibacillus pentosus]MBU7494105.1 ROK family protein [Lactiplantibacillus pentosus]MBU7526731.1 ROK family protein [Lactiplantibacillus pentosus]